jgi:hypothetical protein
MLGHRVVHVYNLNHIVGRLTNHVPHCVRHAFPPPSILQTLITPLLSALITQLEKAVSTVATAEMAS